MPSVKLTRKSADAAKPTATRFTLFDEELKGFGLRVYPSGEKSWIVEYRTGNGGRGQAKNRMKLGNAASMTPEQARKAARDILAKAHLGSDPALDRREKRTALTFAQVADAFLSDHIDVKRKAATCAHYRDLLERVANPELGSLKAHAVQRSDVAKLHLSRKSTPFQANRMIAVIGSMYAFAQRRGLVPDACNPARKIEKYPEQRRERFLSLDELDRIGTAIRQAETCGIHWTIDDSKPTAKHAPKPQNRRTIIGAHNAAALRLLILTGARLREILHLRWEHIDFDRGLLLLPDSKTGRKTIILNTPAMAVLTSLPRWGAYVVAGDKPDKPRADLHKPWRMVSKHAGLEGVRLHDLRHTFASFGASSGLGLPIIGRLLGHTQASTTQRYAHLDNDPARRASNTIASTIAAAMGELPAAAADNIRALPAR